MAALKEESILYEKLAIFYENHKDNISLDVFSEGVNIAKKAERIEIRYILYKLKSLYGDDDLSEKSNKIIKMIKYLFGNNRRKSFIIAILETALEGM